MRALSLWQPWATALFDPNLKAHETRGWAAHQNVIGQRVAVHAAARPVPVGLAVEGAGTVLVSRYGPNWRTDLPRGALLGTVVIVDCRPTAALVDQAEPLHRLDRLFGDWGPGRFAWRVADPRILAEPIPWKGKQGWFQVPDELFEVLK